MAFNRDSTSASSMLGRLAAAVLAAVAAVAPVAFAPAAGAQTPQGPEIVEVQVIGRATKIAKVTVRSPIPVSGTLRCSCMSASTLVDLPTGGERTVWLPMASVSSWSTGPMVWDVPGSKDAEMPVQITTTPEALAVMPSALGSRVAPGSLSAPGRVVLQVFEVSPDDIEQRAWILEGFAMLATTSQELNTLSKDGRRNVIGWVERGGELLVDDTDDVPLIATQPTPERNAFIGSGVVRRTSNAIRTGLWESALLPPLDPTTQDLSINLSRISLRSAVRLAPAGALLAGLLVYALGVGPVAYRLGRRRNHPMLMWVAIPLTAAVTTAGVLGIGMALRSTAHDQYVLVRLHGEQADRVTVARAVVEGSSAAKMRVPSGWLVDGDEMKVDVGTPSTAQVNLPPGGLTELRFTGSTDPTKSPLRATIDLAGNLTVTNQGSEQLDNVFAVDSRSGTLNQLDLGLLAPGASLTKVYAPTVWYASTSLDRERESVGAMVADSGVLNPADVVVIAEVRPRTASRVPGALTSNAKPLKEFSAVAVLKPGPRTARRSNDGIVRIDLPSGDATYGLASTGPSDVIWVDGLEVPATDGPLPAGAVRNGAVVLRSSAATLVEVPTTEFVQ